MSRAANRAQELANLKARMLCHGVSSDADVRREVSEQYGLGRGFIHGTVFMLDGRIPVNTSYLDGATDSAPQLVLDRNGRPAIEGEDLTIPCPPITPLAASADTLSTLTVGDYFTLHNPTTVFAAPLRQCVFISAGRPCLFCTFEGGRMSRLTREQFGGALQGLLAERPAIDSLAIGGGTPNLTDHGVKYYAGLTEEAKSLGLSVSVEIVPPPRLRDLDQLIASGVDALIMSIELWDQDRRNAICLGKSVASRAHYEAAWQLGISSLGQGMVSSVLLYGLEDPEATGAGMHAMIDQGVIPTLLPYRVYDRSQVAPAFPISVDGYLDLAFECGRMLSARRLNPFAQPGCTGCQGCSLEGMAAGMLPSPLT